MPLCLLATLVHFHQQQCGLLASSHAGMYLHLPELYFATLASLRHRFGCCTCLPVMLKGLLQPSLGTISFHLHSLLKAWDDDARALEDELRVLKIKCEAATVLLHCLKNHTVHGGVL